MDLSPVLRQMVKTHFQLNGELSHGIVTQAVHQGVQTGRCAAAGTRGIDWGSGAGVGGEPQCVAALEAGVPSGTRQCVSGQRKAALVRRPDRRVGAQGRPADPGDRFFERVLAAHRGTADAAGTEWKSAGYRKVEEEVKLDRGLTIARMVERGGMSRASFYRYDEYGTAKPDPDMDLRDAIQRIVLEWPCYGRPRVTAAL